FRSIHATAKAYTVPFSTLWDRIKGHKSCNLAHDSERLLTQPQEQALVDWCILLSQEGRALTRVGI
ncbi:hypothetical protein M422DRAFT_157113, partial [Sphaerobolus stellatus SS14]